MSNLTTQEGATVSETKKGAIQGVAGAGAVKAIEWGAPFVLAALGSFWGWWKGLAFPWYVIFGLATVLVLAIIGNLITSMIVKMRRTGVSPTSANDGTSDSIHEKHALHNALIECRSNVGNLEQALRVAQAKADETDRLNNEIRLVTQQKEDLEAQAKRRGLEFEIDAKRTEMQYRGYSDSGKTILIAAWVRLRCSKEVDSKLAVREFLAELRSEGSEAVFADGQLIRAYVDNEAKDSVNIEAGWTIDEQLTGFRFYDFMFQISNEAIRIIGRDLFVRITMNAIGQAPQHKDFFVNSWHDAIKSASGITLRRVT